MSDNIIPRDKAIDRMRDGLPCETWGGNGWCPTDWPDFRYERKFRIPPEPRREARDYWVNTNTRVAWSEQHLAGPNSIHVREVLPDEVPVRRMTEAEVRNIAIQLDAHPSSFTGTVCIEVARALGLIGEDKS